MSEELLAAAEAALKKARGTALEFGAPTKLSGSGRSVVYRVPVTGAAAPTVIVKTYEDTGTSSWENEAVALTLTAGLPGEPVGPELLATEPAHRALILSDLGDHPALSDVLLGSDRAGAEKAFVDWAEALGRFAAMTRDARSLEERTRRAGGYGPSNKPIEDYLSHAGKESLSILVGRRFEVTPPAGLDDDLAAVESLLEPSAYDIFSPGDPCPDNNQLTPEGVRFLDFEFSGCYSLFLDAAYTTAPFPTCWCVLDLPHDLSLRAAGAYRKQVVRTFPALAEDDRWNAGLVRACALWTVTRLRGLLQYGRFSDLDGGAFDRGEVRFPGHIVECHFRINRFLELAGPAVPALTDYLRQIRDRLVSEYGELTMPQYPALVE